MSADENPLSKREQEILTLVARGLTNQEIVRDLVISHNTVKVHLRNIFAKLEVVSRTEAIVKAAQAGWIDIAGIDEQVEGETAMPVLPAAPPLARWQRIWFFAAAAVVLLAVLAPGVMTRLEAQIPTNDFSDAGRAGPGAAQRVETNRWESLASLSEPRSRLALVTVGDVLFAVGGEGAEGPLATVEVYDPETNGWLPGADLPAPRANIRAAAIDGLVYVPGGTGPAGDVSNDLLVYDPAADLWRTGAALPGPRAGYALAALDGKLYLFGGWDGAAYTDSVLEYDPTNDAWRSFRRSHRCWALPAQPVWRPHPGGRRVRWCSRVCGLLVVLSRGRPLGNVCADDSAARRAGTGRGWIFGLCHWRRLAEGSWLQRALRHADQHLVVDPDVVSGAVAQSGRCQPRLADLCRGRLERRLHGCQRGAAEHFSSVPAAGHARAAVRRRIGKRIYSGEED
ncbi:MAG: kelch repeat-containing protein [Caldilineales bacterium]